jgi:hypothetical protein
MGLNNRGWTETQYGLLESGKLVKGQVAINVDGFTVDLGTLGALNSWDVLPLLEMEKAFVR